MTESEIKNRIARVYAAFGEKSRLKPEDCEPVVHRTPQRLSYHQDFRGGRTQEQLEIDAATIINEIMGIRDRTKKWLIASAGNAARVDDFIKSDMAVALVHDLANTEKHGELDRPPFSGHRPKLLPVDRVMANIYDPVTKTYARASQFWGPAINNQTGQLANKGGSTGMEVVLHCDIQDESGNKIGELNKVLADAIHSWEQFLKSLGLTL